MTNERPFHEQYEVRASNGNQVLEDLTAARARIAELEDWQRRAVGTGLLDEHNGCQCRTCRDVTQLLSEAKP